MSNGTWKRIWTDVRATVAFVVLSTAIPIVLLWQQEVGSPPLATLWALASFAAGAAVGFLFGIPRVLQDSSPAGAAATSQAASTGYRLQVNTNLEQISDWLTKIIVGVGLIQLNQMPDRVGRLANFAAAGFGAQTPEAARLLAVGIICYFSVAGFLCGYLMTRIYLAQAFSRADWGAQNTISVAGTELTVAELSAQQRQYVADLQQQVVAIRSQLATALSSSESLASAAPAQTLTERSKGGEPLAVKSILWVDDHPKHNTSLVEQLRNLQIEVVPAQSTREALSLLSSRSFDRVISDMARFEDLHSVPAAGVKLVREMRQRGIRTPVLIYCSPDAVARFREEALQAGASEVTASPVTLLEALRLAA